VKKLLVTLLVLFVLASPVSAGLLTPVSPSSIDIDGWDTTGNPFSIKVDYEGYARYTRLTCGVYDQVGGLPRFTFYNARLPALPRVIVSVWFYDEPGAYYLIGCKATDGIVSDEMWLHHAACNTPLSC